MSPKRGGLGQGASALFQPSELLSGTGEGVSTLRLSEIEPDKGQPRKNFEPQALNDLADSIAAHGVLQPIVVRPARGGYVIVAGERRWRAARLAGLKEIPALVKELTDAEAMELALVENLQREDLDPVEEAMGYRQLMEACGYTQAQAAEKVSKSRSAVANCLRLLNLPPQGLDALRSGAITTGHAKAILGLESPEKQAEALAMVLKQQLTVRQTEALCKKLAKAPRRRRETLPPPLAGEVEAALREALGTQVKVQYKGGKGSLQVYFNSDEQLRRFANLLGKEE